MNSLVNELNFQSLLSTTLKEGPVASHYTPHFWAVDFYSFSWLPDVDQIFPDMSSSIYSETTETQSYWPSMYSIIMYQQTLLECSNSLYSCIWTVLEQSLANLSHFLEQRLFCADSTDKISLLAGESFQCCIEPLQKIQEKIDSAQDIVSHLWRFERNNQTLFALSFQCSYVRTAVDFVASGLLQSPTTINSFTFKKNMQSP